MKRIGIFGGTFNPPHVGHLVLAETAADSLALDRVYFVPAAKPPHKLDAGAAPAEDRYQMVKLAVAGNSRFEVSRADMDRPGPHYAYEMLEIFHKEYPLAEFYFLMGSDSLRDLQAWEKPEHIIDQAHLVVMQRPTVYPDLTELSREYPNLLKRLHFLDAPEIEISSTDIIHRLKRGLSVRYRVTDAVLEYLKTHNLYANHDEETA